MKLLLFILAVMLILLQYELWFGNSSYHHLKILKTNIAQQQKKNQQLEKRNAGLESEVNDLKKGSKTVEQQARTELGMIKKSEKFYLLVK